ncbi:MAG: Fic family protein [Pseudomonadota bacterium]|nr:Fic family protein [Pseudomonadota bacterium]
MRSHADEFRTFAGRNLSRQFDFLEATVKAGLSSGKKVVSHRVIRELNRQAVDLLCEHAGKYRKRNLCISNSRHVPPDHRQVQKLMDQCLLYLGRNWQKKSSVHLAAFALWRLGWIHPFMEGNGRTSRALCLLIICLKHQVWLPGKNLIPKQVRRHKAAYYKALRLADESYAEHGVPDLSFLEAYLHRLLFKGVSRLML